MRVFTMMQRKAVSSGLLWGVLSAAETEGKVLSFLRIPSQVAEAICEACGISSYSMLVYALAILLAPMTAYLLVTGVEQLSSRVLYWHAGPGKDTRGDNQQGRNK